MIRFIASNSLYVIAAGVFLGLLWPDLANLVGPLLPPAIVGMMTIGILRVNVAELRRSFRRSRLLLLLGCWLLVLSPVGVWVACWLLGASPPLVLAVVLTAACPPLMSTVGFAWLLGLSPPLPLAVVTTTTLVCPLTLAAALSMLPESKLALEPIAMFARLAALIGGCYMGAAVLRWSLGIERIREWGSIWDVLTVICLLIFAIGVMDGVTSRALEQPAYVLVLLAVAFALNVLLQLVGVLMTQQLGASGALTVGFASGNRAVGLLLAIAPGDASNDLVLFFALYQIPMYTLPVLLRPFYDMARSRLD